MSCVTMAKDAHACKKRCLYIQGLYIQGTIAPYLLPGWQLHFKTKKKSTLRPRHKMPIMTPSFSS